MLLIAVNAYAKALERYIYFLSGSIVCVNATLVYEEADAARFVLQQDLLVDVA